MIVDSGTKVLGREGNDELGDGMVPAVPGSWVREAGEIVRALARRCPRALS